MDRAVASSEGNLPDWNDRGILPEEYDEVERLDWFERDIGNVGAESSACCMCDAK